MPALTIPFSFTPFTVIRSSQVNADFNAVVTLLNTTKLDSTNIQVAGIARDRIAAGTPNQFVTNDGSGNLSSQAIITTQQGGTGLNYTPIPGDANKVLSVDGTGSFLQFAAPSVSSQGLFYLNRIY